MKTREFSSITFLFVCVYIYILIDFILLNAQVLNHENRRTSRSRRNSRYSSHIRFHISPDVYTCPTGIVRNIKKATRFADDSDTWRLTIGQDTCV